MRISAYELRGDKHIRINLVIENGGRYGSTVSSDDKFRDEYIMQNRRDQCADLHKQTGYLRKDEKTARESGGLLVGLGGLEPLTFTMST